MKTKSTTFALARFLTIWILPLLVGLGIYTFIYAKGGSYFTNDPSACANCHVMREYYDGWLKSSHHSIAVCNDCHAPKGMIRKYYTKARNGFWHSYAFTLNNFSDNLSIKLNNYKIAQETCINCHLELTESITYFQSHPNSDCIHCHGAVGHPKK
ncbi:MAG: cytochrome c nitrite reductase small subunit [Leptospiraceae bacterium]|nr:cytochrome c nitrite reductase small subunit [Leptospiraceae bacterium]